MRDKVERLAQDAYFAYINFRSYDLGSDRVFPDWSHQTSEVKDLWRQTCAETEGIRNPPLAAAAGWPRLEDL